MIGESMRNGIEVTQTISTVFETTAAASPNRTAIVHGNEILTYEELNIRSNRVANYLLSRMLRRGDIVAILLDRSVEMVVALLGVAKAGGAYLPLGLEHPPKRLAYVLQDACPRFLISRHEFAEGIAIGDERSIDIDVAKIDIATQASCSPGLELHANDLAFCIYTSGSTGQPKGVLVENGGIAALVAEQRSIYRVTSEDRILQFASFGFDAYLADLLMAFGSGATLVLRTDELGEALVETLVNQRITIATLPPSLLIRTSLTRVSSLRCIIAAGERCPPSVSKALPQNCEFFNAYGPTEATIWSTVHRVSRSAESRSNMPIGRAIGTTDVWILDEKLSPVKIGDIGEIHLSGLALARGYLNRPDLTAEKFIPNPFTGSGNRLYKTGDLGRLLRDGEIEFIGRIDHQIKLNGYRIELEEIEATLLGCEGVREAVVVHRESVGDRCLAAFVTGETLGLESVPSIVRQLGQHLPDYMIPVEWAVLIELPLNTNGKIDRKAVESLPAARHTEMTPYLAPSSSMEELVARVWRTVLHLETVGRNDGFRRLGGRSIQAVEVGFRLSSSLGKPIPAPVGDAILAEYVHIVNAAMTDSSEVGNIVEWSERYRLSFAQQQVCFMEAAGEAWRAYRCHARLDLTGRLLLPELQAALNQLISRHEILRTGFIQSDGKWRREVKEHVRLVLSCTDLSHLMDGDRESAMNECIQEELAKQFDLSRPPLVRWRLIKLDTCKHVIVQSEHHTVHDGQSSRILMRDLSELYSALVDGRKPELPELGGQYSDYCIDELRWLQGLDYQRQLQAWQQSVPNGQYDGTLFSSVRAAGERTYIGHIERYQLNAELVSSLGNLASRIGVSLYALMFAAFGLLCEKLTRKRKFLIGAALANRTSVRFQDTVGMFVNMLPIPIEVVSAENFLHFAKEVARQIDFALVNCRVPIAEIVRTTNWATTLHGEAPFSTGFSFHDSMDTEPNFSGLDAKVEEGLANGSAKFDLSVIGILSNRTSAAPMELLFEYASDVFTSDEIQGVIQSYDVLLSNIISDPTLKLSDLGILSSADKFKLLAEWNDTKADYPEGKCIHELFEEQVERTPDAVAVIFEEQQLTYGELNARANQLAHYLRELGVKPDSLVAICVERSLEMVVGLLGILKAGGAYVPMEPDWPFERRRMLVRSLNATTLVTCASELSAAEQLAWEAGCVRNVVCLDGCNHYSPDGDIDRDQTAQLWNFVAERSDDEIIAGGFISSFTGEPFTKAEVREYVDRVVSLVGDHVGQESSILEIGCGSGAVAFELLPRVGRFLGIDPSTEYQRRNRAKANQHGFLDARFDIAYAHELGKIEQVFDCIILSSVVQFFPNYRYLEEVLSQCLSRLAPDGVIVVADVIDPAQRKELVEHLRAYKNTYPDAPVKVEREAELAIVTAFFEAFAIARPELKVTVTRRDTSSFSTELAYRYDVVFTKLIQRRISVDDHVTGHRGILTSDPATYRAFGQENPRPLGNSESTAYVIFTSGSTGLPKGVMVRHRPVINLISWVNDFVGLSSSDRLFFVTSICFDLSVYDIFGTLAGGGSIDIVPGCKLKEPDELAQYLSGRPITFWDSAPAAFGYVASFLEHCKDSVAKTTLRTVFLSGDWIPVSMPNQIRSLFPAAKVVALGGATEAAIWSNYFVVDKVEPEWRSIPYGKPIQNARYYVLNEVLDHQPIGVTGDLYIGGNCLASGYYGDAVTTATKFVPDPYAVKAGQVMYRTGDLARFWPDGNIEFLGRIDHQVKIRGFRIELGEVESAINRCSGVKEAIVLARNEGPYEKRLVGFVVCHPGATYDEDNLRRQLATTLPFYMMPEALIALNAWPLTANGKIDRTALQVKEAISSRVGTYGQFDDSSYDGELNQILTILRDIVPGNCINPDDDLIANGMHSLAMMRFVSRCKEQLDASLRVRDIHRLATPRAIASTIRAMRAL